MRTEEYLLLAEIEYWQAIIDNRKLDLSRFAKAEMNSLHDRAVRKHWQYKDDSVSFQPGFVRQELASLPAW